LNFSPTKCMDRQAISLTIASAALSNDWYYRHLFYSSSCSAGMLTCRRPDRKAWTDLTYCHHHLRRSSMWRTSSGTTMMCLHIFLTLSYIHDAHSLTHYITHYITHLLRVSKGQEKKIRETVDELQLNTGFKLRILCQRLVLACLVKIRTLHCLYINLNLNILLLLL